MLELQHIFSRFAPSYLAAHPVPPAARKAVRAITSCRTPALGAHVSQCDGCQEVKVAYHSCRNRNCPKCGNLKKEQWMRDRTAELLPVPYFHAVFTVPHALNPLFLTNPSEMHGMLFKAAADTLTKLARDPKFLGAQIGVTMVLHTWGQNLSFHPHVHCVIPGGGLSPDGRTFVRSRKKFFLPVKVIAKVFRGKLLARVKQAYAEQRLRVFGCAQPLAEPPAFQALLDGLYAQDWVVYCKKPFKSPFHVVQYLSRYTHKTAIANNRLTAMEADRVTFQYRDYKDGSRVKAMTLEAMEFIRRFLQHVLPSGFQRIRHYGFLSNANRQTKLRLCLRLTRTAIRPKVKLSAQALMLKLTGNDLSTCPACGGQWQQVFTLAPNTG